MSNRLEDDWKKSENGGTTSQKKRCIENGDSAQTHSGNKTVRQQNNAANPTSSQTPKQCNLTIDQRDGCTAFVPVMVGNNITGPLNMNLHVETGERNSDAASSPQAKEPQAKEPQADSSEDQRDEDMEVSD